MSNKDLSRRGFIGALGAGTAGFALFVSGCKGGKGGELVCTDVSSLTAAEKQARTALKYLDKSPHADKNCTNCQLFKPGAAGACAACTVIKGPINPKGYCNSWAKKVKKA